ncbi:MAG: hypothetical protein AAF541_13785 [Pseudomonadota bacterium]
MKVFFNKRINKLGAIVLTCVAASACSNSTHHQAPTHRWASTEAVDAAQYRNDHARCQAQADLSEADKPFATDSPAFSQYKQCMNSSGYVLTAYNN